jgi:hypothetical protein
MTFGKPDPGLPILMFHLLKCIQLDYCLTEFTMPTMIPL